MDNKKKVQNRKKRGSVFSRLETGIIVALISLVGTISVALIEFKANWELEQLKQKHEIEMQKGENEYVQKFSNKCDVIEKSGVEYIQYEIISIPEAAGYHVIVFPYLVYGREDNKVYIPITGLFTKEEYAADEDGQCILLRENTSEELQEKVEFITGLPVEIKCLAAIQYVKEEQKEKDVYDLGDGQLTRSEQEVVVEVLKVWEDENNTKIDMWKWPYIDQNEMKVALRI